MKNSIMDSGLRTQDSGLRTQDSGLRTQDSGLRTQDSGLRRILRIDAPRIEALDGKARLTFDIHDPEKGTCPVWYEVSEKYAQYLTDEVSDSCLVCVLLYAMEHDYDIECAGNVSERIYHQLTEYFIPALSQNVPRYKKISITCPTSDIEFHPQAVGAGLSCGVDSFYTILKNLCHPKGSRLKITHLCCFNVGAFQKRKEFAQSVYLESVKAFEPVAKELGCEFFTCDSNVSSFLNQGHMRTHALRTLSVPLAVQKLFSLYYFSSTYQYSKFHISDHDTADYDIFTLPLLSNQNVRFELVGGEVTRLGKLEYITRHEITRRHLNVCNDSKNGGNCSVCGKCIRTMLELDLLGKLDDYSAVFDVEKFRKRKRRYIWAAVCERRQADMAEIVRELRQQGQIGIIDYAVGYAMRLAEMLAEKFGFLSAMKKMYERHI